MIKRITLLTSLLALVTTSRGQTNPTPQTLPYTQNFGTATFATMPTGMAAWLSGGNKATQAAAESSTPAGDASLTTATASTTTGGVFGYAVSSNARPYIQLSSNATNGTSQLGLAFNTGAATSVNISYQVELLNIGATTQDFGLELMYHSGSNATSAWTAVPGASVVISGSSFSTQTYTYTLNGLTASTNYQLRWVTWRAGSGNGKGVGIDNISVTAAASPTVSITGQDPNTPAAVNWAIGASNQMFYWASVAPSGGNATLSSVTANMSGTYMAADIAAGGLKLYYSADATMVPAGDVLLSAQSSAKAGATENISWSSLTQTIATGATGYIYATADVSASATAARTLAGSFTSNANIVFTPTVSYNAGNTYGATTDKTFANLPTNPSIFSVNCSSEARINIDMNAPTTGTVLVFANTTGSYTVPTGAGSSYTGANANYTSASNYPAVGGKLIYSGPGSNLTVLGLTAGQNYSFIAYSYNGSTWSSGTSVITASTVTQPVSSVSVTPSSGQLQLSWTNPVAGICYNSVIVIARQGAAVESPVSKVNFDGLVSGADFTGANSTWTLNTNANDVYDLTSTLIGNDNTNYLVYKGTGNSVLIDGLTNGTPYHFRIFTVDGLGSLARWSSAIDVNGTPDLPAYYWNGGSIAALPANGGTGTWGTANAWRQPGASGAQATWADGNTAVFGGAAGAVTLDANRNATSYLFNTSSYTVQTTSGSGLGMAGPITLANNNVLVLAPNAPSTANGVISLNSISGTGTAAVTIFGNQAGSAAARINIAGGGTVNVPTNIVSSTGIGVGGYVGSAPGAIVNGNITNNSGLTTCIGATSGNDITVNGIISGTSGLQFSAGAAGGAGVITLNGANTYSGPTQFNSTLSATVVLGANNVLPSSSNLIMAYASGNGGNLDLNGTNQSIGNLSSNFANSSAILNNSSTSNSTLTVNQTTAQTYGAILKDGATMKLAVVKNGAAALTLTRSGSNFSGGLRINNGEVRLNPTVTILDLSACPVVLNGGSIGTTGVLSGTDLRFSTLQITDNSTLTLDASVTHSLSFAASNALSWTAAKTLVITGWQGTYTTTTGSAGTAGQVFAGTDATGLTSAQLSQIKFYDGVSYYGAKLLGTGEVVPYNDATTQLRAPYCGYTADTFGEFLRADSVLTANHYRFLLVNSATSYTQTFTNSSGYPYLTLYNTPGISYNTTYTVTVAWSADGVTWSNYGSPCTITSPMNEVTELQPAYCGFTASSYSQIIFANRVSGATQYEYKLVNSALSYTQTFVKTNNNFNLTQFTGLLDGTTYSVSIRVFIFGAWDIYGTSCNVTTPSGVTTTSLQPSSCGVTVSSYPQILYAVPVSGATQYEYRLINSALSYTQTFVKTNNNFNLAQFTGLTNNTTYSVAVRANVSSVWGNFGTACQVTTPSGALTTSLQPASCGITASSYAQVLYATALTGATQYEYRLQNTAASYTQTFVKSNNNFNLTQFTGLTNATTYSVTVRANISGSWGSFGPVCTITTPASSPTSSLQPASCGITLSAYTQILYATAVTGATQYEYRLENAGLGYSQSFVKSNNNFNCGQFTGLANSTTYTVQVRVFFNGAWGNYGPVCTVTTPASAIMLNGGNGQALREGIENGGNGLSENNFEAIAYPNPFNQEFALSLVSYQVNEAVSIRVFDATGRLVEKYDLLPGAVKDLTIGAGYAEGLYNIIVSQGAHTKSIKVIRQ